MAKIDRLGWAAGLAFTSYGASIGVRVNDAAILEQLAHRLPPGCEPAPSPVVDVLYSVIAGKSEPGAKLRRYNLLYAGAALLARTMDLSEVLTRLESGLHMSVATNATPSLFVHAGVVGWRGRAIVIPGRSMSGKSSLVAALVQAGATYYSDEYAVLDEQGYVHAYPKPLSLRNGMARRPVEGVAEAFDTCAGTAPLPVGLIVMTRYRRGARFRPRVLSAGQAVLALMDNTILARVKPELALSILPRAVSLAHTLSGERGEACKIVEPLMQQLERSNATPVQAVPRPE